MGSWPSGESSWWGALLVGNCPGVDVVLEGSCPAGESSGWELSNGELS